MGIDILEGKGIKTYRENDKDFLLDIRNGKYTYDEIFEIADDLDKKFKYAKDNSVLPKKADLNAVNELIYEINLSVLNN